MTELKAPRVTALGADTRRLVWILPSGYLTQRFEQLLREEVSFLGLRILGADDQDGDIVILEYPENQSNQVVFVVYLMNALYRQQRHVRRCWEG